MLPTTVPGGIMPTLAGCIVALNLFVTFLATLRYYRAEDLTWEEYDPYDDPCAQMR